MDDIYGDGRRNRGARIGAGGHETHARQNADPGFPLYLKPIHAKDCE
jgi:hypothetical protein